MADSAAAEPRYYTEMADIVLTDRDPIARQVLAAVLVEADGINLVASVDSRQPVRTWPIHRATVVFLCIAPEDDLHDILSALSATCARVLVVKERFAPAVVFGGALRGEWVRRWSLRDLPEADGLPFLADVKETAPAFPRTSSTHVPVVTVNPR
ncbi:hypothetical protein ACWY4P_46630 [Streptomyces sp. LZ34]